MKELSYDFNLNDSLESGVQKITDALKTQGFGVLTRIDFDKKIHEKLGKSLHPIAILGACNPKLAYEAYLKDANMLLLVPCNVVLEEYEPKKLSVKMMKPSSMMQSLDSKDFLALAQEADNALLRVKDTLSSG